MRRREGVTDGLLGAVLLTPVVVHQVMSGGVAGTSAALAAVAAVGLTARRWPVAGWLVVVLGTLVDGNFVFALPVLSYLVGLRTERIRGVSTGAFGAVAAVGTTLNLVVLGTSQAQWFFLAMLLVLLGVFPWLAGRYRAQQARLISAGWERAARLESGAAAWSGCRERARIAQEMHDSLGHELSLIALSAGGLETTPGLAEPQRAAAGRIRESAATATDRLHEIIGVLRDDWHDDEDIASLVARSRNAGMTVDLVDAGNGERLAYQVVREGLTNASRHAPGAAVTVTLSDVGVAVVNGAAVRTGTVPATARLGIVGLRERVREKGGSLIAEPTPDGGFRLVASLPKAAGPAPEGGEAEMRRRARRSLVAAALTPVALVTVTALGYYPFAVAGSVLERQAYERMTIGTPRAELALPDRQASGERAPGCELYSDGNFPMADATYRLCFTDGRLSRKERIR